MFYITFNDYPGGIYKSQVIDVLEYLNDLSQKKIHLIAFISLRKFFQVRKIIKNQYRHSIVLPMFPCVQNWKWNRVLLFFLLIVYRPKLIIARGIFAFHISLPFKKLGILNKIILDARGAYKAEFEEYSVVSDKRIIKQIPVLENKAIRSADFKIAVSEELVNYWHTTYKHNSQNHVIIPCTLSKEFIRPLLEEASILNAREKLGYDRDDIIILFSGSSSAWQSLEISDRMFISILEKNPHVHILLLGQHDIHQYEAYKHFPGRLKQLACSHTEVFNYLNIGDYGWLVREQSITNKVASPVKFAEYLSAGLKIIISDNLGDYSKFCINQQCGHVIKNIDGVSNLKLEKLQYSQKQFLHSMAMQYFTKERYQPQYLQIINGITK